jgi:hypothetical protein
MAAIILRVLYNNGQYRAKCTFPDPLCWKCIEARRDLDRGRPLKLNIVPPKLDDKDCSGVCWERDLLKALDWGNDQRFPRVIPGMKAYLVFERKNDKNRIGYSLWGSTTVKGVDESTTRKISQDSKDRYRHWIHFEPFDPLPRDIWSTVLADRDLVGSSWRQGFYRYVYDEGREAFLRKLASGTPYEEASRELSPIASADKMAGGGLLAPHIEQKVQEIADNHGRTREEIIRQAVAEWLKKQE